jgi:fumarate hydratase class II
MARSAISSRQNPPLPGLPASARSTFPPTAIAAADRTLEAKISFERPGQYESVIERFNTVATGLRNIADDAAITIGGSQGHFALNVDKPLLAYCMMHSIQLLADVARSFTEHCVDGIRADENRIRDLMQCSLMLVTALAPKIGYDNAAKVAKSAHARGTTLKEEAVRLGFVS